MRIGVVGYGMVGKAITQAFTEIGHQVSVYDIKLPETKLEDILKTDLCYICVPTQPLENGACDISNVENVVGLLSSNNYTGTVAVKSTVAPGTTAMLGTKYNISKICHVPEFLRERCGYEDFTEHHNVLIVGTENKEAFNHVVESHGKYPRNIVQVHPTESELTKYFSNSFKAYKTVFANTFAKIAEGFNVDYNNILQAFLLENVSNEAYFKSGKGFGGACLPKDVSAINFEASKLGLNLFEYTLNENEKFL